MVLLEAIPEQGACPMWHKEQGACPKIGQGAGSRQMITLEQGAQKIYKGTWSRHAEENSKKEFGATNKRARRKIKKLKAAVDDSRKGFQIQLFCALIQSLWYFGFRWAIVYPSPYKTRVSEQLQGARKVLINQTRSIGWPTALFLDKRIKFNFGRDNWIKFNFSIWLVAKIK